MLRLPLITLVVFTFAPALHAQRPIAFFDAPIPLLPEDSPPFQKLFDQDGDGDMDAVGSRVYSTGLNYQVTVWRNDQGRLTPFFNETQPLTSGLGRNMRVATGDLDGDGDQDFVAAEGFLVAIYSNQGTTFARSTFAVTQQASDVAIADFDGDGRQDLAVLCRAPGSSNPGPGFVLLRLASGAQVTGAIPVALPPYTRLETCNLDGDAASELGAWYVTQSEFHPIDLVGNTLVVLPSMQPAITTPGRWCYWASGDIDGDSDTDLVAFELPTTALPGHVHCYRCVAPGTFVPEPAYAGGPAEMLADADGDGDLDGVCCGGGGGGGTPAWPTLDFGSYFEIALNRGQGIFEPAFRMPGKGSSRLAGVADLDGDAHPDYVAGACVYYGRGDLSGATAPPTGMPFSEIFDVAFQGTQLGDQDRDGDPDFLFALDRRCVNDGTGAMALRMPAQSPVPAGYSTQLPQFRGDFDGDGAPDLVAPLFLDGPTPSFSHMGFFRNNGSGELAHAGAAAAAGLRIGWLAYSWVSGLDSGFAADVDDDGDQDIVANADISYEAQMRTEIFWNQGGQFAAGPTILNERIELLADFDGDGVTDAVTRSNYPGALQLRLGTGSATVPFGPPLAVFPAMVVDLHRDSLLVVDANDDGRKDVLVRTYLGSVTAGNGLVLCCNTTTTPGQPAFASSSSLFGTVSYGLGYASVFDVDGDGRSDIVLHSPSNASWVARILRRIGGDGQPLQPQHFAPPVDQIVHGGHAADADGDGDLDLVGLLAIKNLHHAGLAAGVRRQYGSGTSGEAGITPLLGATGPLRAGGTKLLRLSGVTGPTMGLLAIGVAPADLPNFLLPGLRLHIDPAAFFATMFWPLPDPGNGHAGGFSAFSIALPAAIQGLDFYDQAFVLDPAAPSGVASSNGLFVHVGG